MSILLLGIPATFLFVSTKAGWQAGGGIGLCVGLLIGLVVALVVHVIGITALVRMIVACCEWSGVGLGVEGDCADDVVEVVSDTDRSVGKPSSTDAPTAENLFEVLLICAVIGNGRGRVFELVSGENTNNTIGRSDDPFFAEAFGTRHACSTRGFAADPASADPCLRVHDLLVTDLANQAVTEVERSQAFLEVDGTIDLDGGRDRRRLQVFGVEMVVVGLGDLRVGQAIVPGHAVGIDELVEGLGTGGVDHGEPRNPINQAKVLEFNEGFAEGARVSEVAAGYHDPVGRLPGESLQDPIHDGLLTFEPERVDRVHQIDAQPVRNLADPMHGVVEVADDLNRKSPVIKRLSELAIGDLTRADEDDGLEPERGCRTENRQRGGGIARAGAGDPLRPNHPGVSKRGCHSIIFEAAGGIHSLILKHQATGIHSHVLADLVRNLKEGLPLADRHDLIRGGEREEFSKSPDAREAQGIEPIGPLGFKVGESARNLDAIPVVNDVEQIATFRASKGGLIDRERVPARGIDTPLISQVGLGRATGGHNRHSRLGRAAHPDGRSHRD